jgi:methylenetetrahydrofolate dehydrogenase (NADP+)/methenyltetrahydrofolate cyclohydrolase
MIVDGRKIADEALTLLQKKIDTQDLAPHLTIFVCEPNFETQKYLALKRKRSAQIGVGTNIIELMPTSNTEEVVQSILKAVELADGIIVQLPLPSHIDAAKVVAAIPITHDVDALNPKTTDMLSPVTKAIEIILNTYKIPAEGRFVTVLGSGKLVGLPAYHWFVSQGAHVSVVTKETKDIAFYTQTADIVVCGAGVPGLLKADMVKEGAVILDAGTTEDGGELRGDADPDIAGKAALFTPVPGGIGPITIAMLLSNVVHCAERKIPGIV